MDRKTGDTFRVGLEIFEGPIDLLLYVVQQRRIDFAELPLAVVARDFLDYSRTVMEIDLDEAGEYIYLASILLRMKVGSLLPGPEPEEEALEPEEALRSDEELEEIYRSIVAAARKLAEGESEQMRHFPRGGAAEPAALDETEELLRDVTLFNLAEAFRDVTRKMEQEKPRQLAMFQVTIEQQSAMIINALSSRGKLSFADLARSFSERMEAVVTFLAILALVRLKRIRVRQRGIFGPIMIEPGTSFDSGASLNDISFGGEAE